jgi:hypothetical protein
MELTGKKQFALYYQFITNADAERRSLPVSTVFPNPDGWVTIPWNQLNINPATANAQIDPDTPPIGIGAWSILHGPCWYSLTAEVGLEEPTQQAQSHIRLYETDSADSDLVVGKNAWEWMIGTKETNTAHIDGAWEGYLAAGRRLRVAIDYWHATKPAKIYRANVQGTYWRL